MCLRPQMPRLSLIHAPFALQIVALIYFDVVLA
jgi:hypothetical protein